MSQGLDKSFASSDRIYVSGAGITLDAQVAEPESKFLLLPSIPDRLMPASPETNSNSQSKPPLPSKEYNFASLRPPVILIVMPRSPLCIWIAHLRSQRSVAYHRCKNKSRPCPFPAIVLASTHTREESNESNIVVD